ncbi:ABC transporter permease [Tomitella cavernea]|uniref:Proline/glycine betaine ABC transporter permease n=1 Tax=Tomitella cavernea TaxID=1387982 RepID=A0ABP9CUE9_9ACTN|nr:proline/glycine betaine ABC transporter permease [Tomitella cavernea]
MNTGVINGSAGTRDGVALLADTWHVPRIHVGDWFDTIVTWLTNNVGPLFDFISTVVSSAVDWLTDVLTYLPPWGMIIIFAVLALWIRGWKAAVVTVIGFGIIDGMLEFEATMQTLAQVLFAAVIAVVLAVPLGIWAARNATVSRIVRPLMDFLQTLPVFVYLIPVIFFFSIGTVPGIVATVAFSLPPGVRLTELGIRQVDPEMVEAGEAFGTSPWRILTGIQLPLALPSIMAGVNQVIMLALSMQVVAGMVGAPGLGTEVFGAVTRLQLGAGFEAGIAVVILAIYLDRLSASFGNRSVFSRMGAVFGVLRRSRTADDEETPADADRSTATAG